MTKQKRGWTDEQKKAASEKVQARLAAKAAEKANAENSPADTVKIEQIKDKPVNQKSDNELDELKKIIREQMVKQNDLEAKIAALGIARPTSPDDKSYKKFGTSLRKEIPPEDRYSIARTFIYAGGSYVMSGYMKAGTEVYAPYDRPIIFVSSNTIQRQINNETKYFQVSVFSTYSKKEAAFVENCPEYGMTIFTKMQDVERKADLNLINQIQRASMYVNGLTDAQLLNEAQTYKIATDINMDEIRTQLKSFKLAEILSKEREKTQEVASRLFEHDMSERKS
jgi:hypothetical protein